MAWKSPAHLRLKLHLFPPLESVFLPSFESMRRFLRMSRVKLILQFLNFSLLKCQATRPSNCPFEVQMESGNEFSNFHLIKPVIGVHHKKDHIKISQITTFEVLSLNWNHVKGFQNSEKLESLYGFGRCHLTEFFFATFDRSQPVENITKLGKRTNLHVIFLAMGFISSFDTIPFLFENFVN